MVGWCVGIRGRSFGGDELRHCPTRQGRPQRSTTTNLLQLLMIYFSSEDEYRLTKLSASVGQSSLEQAETWKKNATEVLKRLPARRDDACNVVVEAASGETEAWLGYESIFRVALQVYKR